MGRHLSHELGSRDSAEVIESDISRLYVIHESSAVTIVDLRDSAFQSLSLRGLVNQGAVIALRTMR